MDPAHVLNGTRLVEIEDKAGSKHVSGLLADLHGPPGGLARGLKPPLDTLRIRRKPGAEGHRLRLENEILCGVVHDGRLVKIDIEAVVRLHLKCRLHGIRRNEDLPGLVEDAVFLVAAGYFAQAALGVVVLLRVVVAADPPGGVVARQGEFRPFFLYLEICQRVLLREFITQPEAVVIEPEAYVHRSAVSLQQMDQKFIVMVAYLGLLAPDRLPRFVETVGLGLDKGESLPEILPVHKRESQC